MYSRNKYRILIYNNFFLTYNFNKCRTIYIKMDKLIILKIKGIVGLMKWLNAKVKKPTFQKFKRVR